MNLSTISKKINPKNIINHQYTVSLLKEAYNTQLIDNGFLYNVQIKISIVLKDLIIKYTKGQSSSVTIETAERLINAIWYTVDSYTQSFENIEESINAIRNESINQMHQKGLKILKIELENTKKLYQEVLDNMIATRLIAYNDTLREISDFFTVYNIEFSPHEASIGIDYPLTFDDMNIEGLHYIKNYLKNIKLENEFCNLLKNSDIEKLLYSYGQMYEINYEDVLINIFETVLNNSIFTVIIGNEPKKIRISKEEYFTLEEKISLLNDLQINSIVDEAFKKIIINLEIEKSSLIRYIYDYKKVFVSRLINSIKRNNLKNILVINMENTYKEYDYIIENENNLDDEAFRNIIEKIIESNSIEEKLSIIRTNINNTKDFIDILHGDCLFNEEYLQLFEKLEDLELVLLGKILFSDDYRNNELDLMKSISIKRQRENQWEECFIKFIKEQEPSRIIKLQVLISNLGDLH